MAFNENEKLRYYFIQEISRIQLRRYRKHSLVTDFVGLRGVYRNTQQNALKEDTRVLDIAIKLTKSLVNFSTLMPYILTEFLAAGRSPRSSRNRFSS